MDRVLSMRVNECAASGDIHELYHIMKGAQPWVSYSGQHMVRVVGLNGSMPLEAVARCVDEAVTTALMREDSAESKEMEDSRFELIIPEEDWERDESTSTVLRLDLRTRVTGFALTEAVRDVHTQGKNELSCSTIITKILNVVFECFFQSSAHISDALKNAETTLKEFLEEDFVSTFGGRKADASHPAFEEVFFPGVVRAKAEAIKKAGKRDE